jgi:hypothetical protein
MSVPSDGDRIYPKFKRLILGFVVLTTFAHAQSLQETFDWMGSTLRPTEGNNYFIHHPYSQPYPKDWLGQLINPFHKEVIGSFSHDQCQVKLSVNVIDNDMGLLFGKQLYETETDTFNLRDIDPNTIQIVNSCEPWDTNDGKVTPTNCEDVAGLTLEFRTTNAKPTIHRESVSSSYKSEYGIWEVAHDPENSLDKLCKEMPGSERPRQP